VTDAQPGQPAQPDEVPGSGPGRVRPPLPPLPSLPEVDVPAAAPAEQAEALGGLSRLPPLPEIGDVRRRPPPGGARRQWQQSKVVEIRRETDRMKTFRLHCDPPMPHVPGQHVVVRLTAPDGYQASRSYSIASAPMGGSEIELMVERLEDGEVSMYLHDGLRVGDDLEIRGAFGGWFVWNGGTPALLVGGGSGVVPLMSMLRHSRNLAARNGADAVPEVRLVESVRSPEELPFADEYGQESTILYTRSTPTRWPRPAGRISAADFQPLLIPGATAYVCGSAGFAEAASQLLVDLGHPVHDVRVERYGPTS
jgi:ferredoxin-NADP reductase